MMANQCYSLFRFFRALGNDWLTFTAIYLQQLKVAIEALFNQFYPFPIDQLLISMVFGRSSRFDRDLRLKFNIIGMLHVVCASGFNVNLVTSLFEKPLKLFLGRKAVGGLLIGLVWFYCALAQSGVSLIRASVMITLKILCRNIFLSQFNVVASFYLSCLLLLLVKFEWWQSISFQLTVAATWGMIFLLPALKFLVKFLFKQPSYQAKLSPKLVLKKPAKFAKKKFKINWAWLGSWLEDSFLVSLAAQLAVLPLIFYYFGQFSWISFATNSLIIWLTPVITWLGVIWSLAAGLFSLINLNSNILFASSWLVALPVRLFLILVDWFAQRGQLSTVNNFKLSYVVSWYFVLIVLHKTYKILLKTTKNKKNRFQHEA
jgi:competence protein ComEC